MKAESAGEISPLQVSGELLEDIPAMLVLSQSCLVRQMPEQRGKQVCMYGYLVTTKPVRTIKGEQMHFGCFVDCEGSFFDTVHFPAAAQNHPFRGRAVYRLCGRVVEEAGFLSLEVSSMEKLPRKSDPRAG
jgi:DNA polymerase-3 subunit alpha